MKNALLSIVILCLSLTAFSQTPVQITEGRFSITGHAGGEAANNAVIKTDLFSATSTLGGQYSPWFDICITSPFECAPGKTISVPKYQRVSLGGCVGDCQQFIGGAFTIGGETYENVYFRGYFDFSRETFTIPKMNRRRGTVVFRKPFTLTGQLQACKVIDFNNPCPEDKVLFNGAVSGHGTLIATFTFKTAAGLRDYPVPYLFQQRFEYVFEP